jgi:hypothetical protein
MPESTTSFLPQDANNCEESQLLHFIENRPNTGTVDFGKYRANP